MKRIATELGTRLLVLVIMLCAFAMIYAIGCVAVFKNVLVDNWRAVAE